MSEREQLEQAIAHMESQRPILGDAVVDAAIATLNEKLAVLQLPPVYPLPAEQRKQVTILFADASGFTEMSEEMDAEDVREMMNDLWARLDGAITSHGGMVDKHVGDQVMALFGAPTAREDDPERAIRAALVMQAELNAFRETWQIPLEMRIGINTGPVLLGEVGTTAEYTAMGDAVNLASRLEKTAPRGGILISHNTYRHVRGVFETRSLGSVRIRGRMEPVQVYLVEEAKPRAFRVATRGVEGIETRMVGREAELRRLQGVFYTVMEDRGAQAVTIVGEAGMGKSRLLYEFDNWIELLPETILYFTGRARQQTRDLPYALVRDLFSSRFQIRDSDPVTVAREKLEQGIVELLGVENGAGTERAHFIGQLIGFDFSESPYLRGIIGDARQIRDRAFHYVAQLFGIATRQEPAVVFLEDIHWADDGSLDLVDYMARECRQSPMLIVALARPTLFDRRPSWGIAGSPVDDQVHSRLDLGPLTSWDSRRLVGEILRRLEDMPPDLQELIVRQAEGNPFYVEELVKVLIEDGVIVKGPDRWRVEIERLVEMRVPPTLTGVLQARLDRLPLLEREVLQRASVVGRVFWDSAVACICAPAGEGMDEDDVGPVLQLLQEKELVFERKGTSAFEGDREYIFKHAVLHQVTYESVLKRRRRVYHAQAAEWLAERSGERVGEYAGLIGEHYERAEEWTSAAEWYGQAGRQAQETYALEMALAYYKKALALEERWEWHKGQVEILHVLGQRGQEEAILKTLEAAPETPVCEAAYLWGQYYEAIGDYGQAQAAVERALVAARDSGYVVGELRCLAKLGLVARRQGDFEKAKDWYGQALAVFENQETYPDGLGQALLHALNGLGLVHCQQTDFDQAWVCYERALMLSRISSDRQGEAETLNHLGITAFYRRDFAEALSHHRRALKIRQAIGDRNGEGLSWGNLAQVAREVGDYGQAREYLSSALTILQATGNRWGEANAWNELGILYQELGDFSQARTCLQQGLTLSREIGDESGQAYILSNLGPVVRDQGDLATAEQLLREGLALARKQDDRYMVSYYLSHLATVSLGAKRLDQAVEHANTALAMRQELALTLWTTADLTTLAAVRLATGDTAQALDYVCKALDILDECGGEGPESPQQDYFACYQVLTAIGNREDAHAALESAYDLVMARADKITDPDLRQSFLTRVPVNREIVREYVRRDE
jgi:class 3 adenylate cyclase/tetratricopeptide (TPR) repeat protein